MTTRSPRASSSAGDAHLPPVASNNGARVQWDWLHPGQSSNKGQGVHDVFIWVAAGEISTNDAPGMMRNERCATGPAYLNTHSVLLVNGGRTIVDWSAVYAKFTAQDNALGASGDKGDPALNQALTIGAVILSALSTAFTTIGPAGAFPSGILAAIASIMGMGVDTNQPLPPPPTIAEITAAVTKIVEQELRKDDAREAAVSFSLAQQWLLDSQDQIRSALAQNDPSVGGRDVPVWLEDFEEQLTHWLNPNEDFRQHIELMSSQPQTAMWIIPSVLSGFGAHLQMWRLNDLLTEQYDVTASTVTRYKREVDRCRAALIATGQAWTKHVNDIVASESLTDTPEGDQLAAILTQAVAGVDEVGPKVKLAPGAQDTTPIAEAADNLRQMSDALANDIANMQNRQPSTIYWKWGGKTDSKLPPHKRSSSEATATPTPH